MADDTLEFKKLSPPERRRAYLFPGGRVEIEDVTAVCVRPSGGHRVETGDGRKYIVSPGWLAIELDTDGWMF